VDGLAYAEVIQIVRKPAGPASDVLLEPTDMFFDPVNAQLIISVRHLEDDPGGSGELIVVDNYRVAISGFTPLFDIATTFEKTIESFFRTQAEPEKQNGAAPAVTANLAFRVPAKPEGLDGADRFDTYWGELDDIDFTSAQGLRCNYPVGIPEPGDSLEVADSLPDPPPGTGYYYVTAVSYQGQTRYGRQAQTGELSGRDPALLPACIESAP